MDIYRAIMNLKIQTLNYESSDETNFHLNSIALGFDSGDDLRDYLAISADDSSGLFHDLLLAKIAQLRLPQKNHKYVKLSIIGNDLVYSGRERAWNDQGVGVRTPFIISSEDVCQQLKKNANNRPKILEYSDEISYWISSWKGNAFIEVSVTTQCLPELFSDPPK
jgi:hypothetical protein